MKKMIMVTTLFGLLACSAPPGRPQIKRIAGDPAGAGAGGSDGAVAGTPGEASTVPIDYAPSPGSAMRMMDGKALTVLYTRVFPKRAYGFEICKGDKVKQFRDINDCTDSLFTVEERPFVGTVSLNTPDFNRGTQNLRQPEDLTLNYMRTLRAALSRECEARIAVEYEGLATGNVANNYLVKSAVPTKEAVEEFFRRILGIEGTKMPVDFGVDAYLAAFHTVAGGKSDPETIKTAYFGLCISVAMDPQVFIY